MKSDVEAAYDQGCADGKAEKDAALGAMAKALDEAQAVVERVKGLANVYRHTGENDLLYGAPYLVVAQRLEEALHGEETP